MERIVFTGAAYAQGQFEFQDPWWAGYNDARNGYTYRNEYVTLTSKAEYQKGYTQGA